MQDVEPVSATPPPLEPANAPLGVVVELLPQGGFRVVLRRTTPTFFAGSLLAVGLGAAIAWSSSPAGTLPSASGSLALAFVLGISLFAAGVLSLALCVWAIFNVVTCIATLGRLEIHRGTAVLRPRLVAVLTEGPIEAVRTFTHHGRPGLLSVRVRIPFLDQSLELYQGETDAVWVALFLAKACDWQAFVSSDAGQPDRSA